MAWERRTGGDEAVYQRQAGSDCILAAWADRWSAAVKERRSWQPFAGGRAGSFAEAMEAADAWAWAQGYRPERFGDA